jgi:DNA-binding protein Fis
METFLKQMGKCIDSPQRTSPDSSAAEVFIRCSGKERVPTLDEAEDILIAQAMRRAGNNQGIAAGYLGINRSALNKKLTKKKCSEYENN